MSLPSTFVIQQSKNILSVLPTAASLAIATTTTQLSLAASGNIPPEPSFNTTTPGTTLDDPKVTNNNKNDDNSSIRSSMLPSWPLPPRAVATLYMAAAMTLHFAGYEFIRNSCLALFTSASTGFSHPAAFPLVNGLVSPFSVLLLWAYSRQLQQGGPRVALRNTTTACIAFIVAVTTALFACRQLALPTVVSQAVIGLTFLFQNSYQHLLYTQHWSFVGSVVTPKEGVKWFAVLAGTSSLFCSLAGSLVPFMLPITGLLGLMGVTAVMLTGTLFCADRAYALAQEHGFDPAQEQQKRGSKYSLQEQNRLSQAFQLFRRVPTLAVLFAEVLSFQSLNTILNVAFVRSLKNDIIDDQLRAAYTGRFYSAINAVSAALQFGVVPILLKYTEPSLIWRLMPLIPLGICLQVLQGGDMHLSLLAAAFFSVKVMDYGLRSVIYMMVYQPLDFESRFYGKEVIGIFGSRFGKSGMSLILSVLTTLGLTAQQQLGQLSLVASLTWTGATWWLSRMLPNKAEAQATVEKRSQSQVVVDEKESTKDD